MLWFPLLKKWVLIRVITHPTFSGTVLVYTTIPACHLASALFQSQKYPGLNNKSYVHLTPGKVMKIKGAKTHKTFVTVSGI